MNFEQERRALIRIRTCPRLELQDTSKSQLYSMKVKALVDKTSQTVIKDLPPLTPRNRLRHLFQPNYSDNQKAVE